MILGSSSVIFSIYFQTIKPLPRLTLQSKDPVKLLFSIIEFCRTLPLKEKKKFLKEPEAGYLIEIPAHSMSLKPAEILLKLNQGTPSTAILEDLFRPSGVSMSDVLEKNDFAERWTALLPKFLQEPFQNSFKFIDHKKISLEEYGQAMMETLREVYGIEPDFKQFSYFEGAFLSLLPSEFQRKIPFQIIGDLNSDCRKLQQHVSRLRKKPINRNNKILYVFEIRR